MRSLSPHPLRPASIALFTALTLLAPTARAAESGPAGGAARSPTQVPGENDRLEKARTLYAADDYLPAAVAFEGLHDDTQNPLYLYYAGLAREGAGHDAHAIRHWQQALRLGLDSEFVQKAQSRLDQARARTTALTITVDPPGLASGATLELRAAVGQREPVVVALAELPVYLESGKWTATLIPGHPAFAKLELPLTITRTAPTASQQFKFKAIEHPTTFEFTPDTASLAGVVLTLRDPDELVPERRVPVDANPQTIALRAGTWHYTLEAPGHPARSGTVRVTPDGPPVTLALPTTTVAGTAKDALLPKPTRRKLALGLGIGGLAPAAAGAVLTILAVSDQSNAPMMGGYYNEKDLLRANTFFGVGPMLLASAGGLWLGSVVSALPARRRAWYGVLGTGAIVGVAGVAWNAGTYPQRNDDFADNTLQESNVAEGDWTRFKTHMVASSALIGLGVGLCISSVAALISARTLKRRRSETTRVELRSDPIRPGFALRF